MKTKQKNAVDACGVHGEHKLRMAKAKEEKQMNNIGNVTEKEQFEKKCYEMYQLDWMMSHGYSLSNLFDVMLQYEKEMFQREDFIEDGDEKTFDFDEDDLERSAVQARDIFLYEQGFGSGTIFACFGEFLDHEYLDVDYMKHLFETQVAEADALKRQYQMYTGNWIPEQKMELNTTAGSLLVYESEAPENPGVIVMLKPNGVDDVIDVAQVLVYETKEAIMTAPVTTYGITPKDVAILLYDDATTEDYTDVKVLKRATIDKGFDIAPVSGDELKKLILDEWIRFTFGEGITAEEIDNIPQDLLDEIAFRCDSLEVEDITVNIRACLAYAKDKGNRALMKEEDDCNIWEYCESTFKKDEEVSYRLARRPHNFSASYTYDWYPNMTKEEAEALVKKYSDERNSSYDPYATIFCLEGDVHKPDGFIQWKEALENRTMAFEHDDMRINDENVEKLKPRGYIVMITEPYND